MIDTVVKKELLKDLFKDLDEDNKQELIKFIKEVLNDTNDTTVKIANEVKYTEAPLRELPPLVHNATLAQTVRAVNYVINHINKGVKSD